ncbi:hypothetical protein DYB26_012009, partial [Aphanomyces astaci]
MYVPVTDTSCPRMADDDDVEWEECADEFGRSFFMHKTTGETTWELPSSSDKTVDESGDFVLDATTVSRLDRIRSQLLLLDDDMVKRMAAAAVDDGGEEDEEWIHSFDPVLRQAYYYECHHGSITTHPPRVFRDEDPLFTVLLVIQCAFRCALARMRVRRTRQHGGTDGVPTSEEGGVVEPEVADVQDAAVDGEAGDDEPVAAEGPLLQENDEPRALQPPPQQPTRLTASTPVLSRLVEAKKPVTKEVEAQREADERRGMLLVEKKQCSKSDRFWGIDQGVEEQSMRDAEDLRRNLHVQYCIHMYDESYSLWVQEAARKREEIQRRAMEELERRRRSEDSALESRERSAMQLQELLQCKTDTFWGVQKQENDETWCQQHMVLEDNASRQYMQDVCASQLHATWAAEAARAVKEANLHRIQQETRDRKNYLRPTTVLHGTKGKVKYGSLKPLHKHGHVQRHPAATTSSSPDQGTRDEDDDDRAHAADAPSAQVDDPRFHDEQRTEY